MLSHCTACASSPACNGILPTVVPSSSWKWHATVSIHELSVFLGSSTYPLNTCEREEASLIPYSSALWCLHLCVRNRGNGACTKSDSKVHFFNSKNCILVHATVEVRNYATNLSKSLLKNDQFGALKHALKKRRFLIYICACHHNSGKCGKLIPYVR